MKPHTDTMSYWIDSTKMQSFASLDRDLHVDVVVVGGGITGLTAAYLLVQAGRSVALLERERCAQIDTGHTSAHLTMATDASLTELVERFGRDHAQAAWDAGLAAMAQIDAAARDEQIACDFAWVTGYLHRPPGDTTNQTQMFQQEAALAADMGFDAAFIEDVPLVGGAGVAYEHQARMHPRKYLAGLARAIRTRGGHIFELSAAEEFCDAPLSVKANGRTVTCEEVVLATHTPLTGNASLASATLFQTKLALYSTYVVAGRMAKGQVPDALFWDTADPYHYLRVAPDHDYDLVIFGGEDHKTGQAANTELCFERLERALMAIVPSVEVTYRWSGQVIETPDGLPFIGDTADHQFAATGFSGNGMTFGTLSGMMAADRILGRNNPWQELFDTGRTKVRGGAWNYIRENKDYPYYMIRDRFAGAEARSVRAVKRGEGKIIERGGQLVAAARDEEGSVTVRSAICTHMGCLVDWNEAERTWDCPCHGSRFKPDGSVLAGPAESPLPEIGGD